MKSISREELYEQLWKVPISRLAIGLGYSYPELVKICGELKIPRPSGGYWYRLQHGGGSEKVPLPSAPEGTKAEIPLGPRLSEPDAQEDTDQKDTLGARTGEADVATEDTKENSPPIEASVEDNESSIHLGSKPADASTPVRVAPEFPDTVEMSREELYQHVWTTPIHLLAQALGLSDVGLAKTCSQMHVPRPGRGYWARLDAGESVDKLKLPPPPENTPLLWTFNVAANRKRRAEWAAENFTAKSKGYSIAPITLPGEQDALHEIALRHRDALERTKRDEHDFAHLDMQSFFLCDVSASLTPKLVRAIHALVLALEHRNCHFVRGDKDSPNLQIGRGKERLTVRWREDLEEIEREPTIEEKRKPSWTWQLKEKRATGRITVEVSAVGLRGQRSWTESENKPLEDVLARVLEKIAAAFDGLVAQRVRDAERERQRIERERQWAELEVKGEVERKEKEKIAHHEHHLSEIAMVRRKNLWVAAQRWEDSQRALAYISAVENHWLSLSAQLSPIQIQWLAWARAEAEKLAPWADNYPDPESAKLCDPANIPTGGPYPSLRKLEPSEFSRHEPRPDSGMYSQRYGYSRY